MLIYHYKNHTVQKFLRTLAQASRSQCNSQWIMLGAQSMCRQSMKSLISKADIVQHKLLLSNQNRILKDLNSTFRISSEKLSKRNKLKKTRKIQREEQKYPPVNNTLQTSC